MQNTLAGNVLPTPADLQIEAAPQTPQYFPLAVLYRKTQSPDKKHYGVERKVLLPGLSNSYTDTKGWTPVTVLPMSGSIGNRRSERLYATSFSYAADAKLRALRGIAAEVHMTELQIEAALKALDAPMPVDLSSHAPAPPFIQEPVIKTAPSGPSASQEFKIVSRSPVDDLPTTHLPLEQVKEADQVVEGATSTSAAV